MAVSLMRRAQTQISRSTDTAGNFNTALSAAGQLLVARGPRRALTRRPRSRPRRAPARLDVGDLARRAAPSPIRAPRIRPCSDRSTSSCPPGATIALVGENGAGKTHARQAAVRHVRADRRANPDRRRRPAPRSRRPSGAERVTAAFQDFARLQLRAARERRRRRSGADRRSPTRTRAPRARRHEPRSSSDCRPDWPRAVGSRFTGGHELVRRSVAAARAGPRPYAPGAAAGRAR